MKRVPPEIAHWLPLIGPTVAWKKTVSPTIFGRVTMLFGSPVTLKNSRIPTLAALVVQAGGSRCASAVPWVAAQAATVATVRNTFQVFPVVMYPLAFKVRCLLRRPAACVPRRVSMLACDLGTTFPHRGCVYSEPTRPVKAVLREFSGIRASHLRCCLIFFHAGTAHPLVRGVGSCSWGEAPSRPRSRPSLGREEE